MSLAKTKFFEKLVVDFLVTMGYGGSIKEVDKIYWGKKEIKVLMAL